MTEAEILNNTFFAFFNSFGNNFLMILAFISVLALVFCLLHIIVRR
jgi:hypothetical protein